MLQNINCSTPPHPQESKWLNIHRHTRVGHTLLGGTRKVAGESLKVPPAKGILPRPQLQWEGRCDCQQLLSPLPQERSSALSFTVHPTPTMFFICMGPLGPARHCGQLWASEVTSC